MNLSPKDSALVDQIQEVRRHNNRLWMDLVRLALEVAPDRARAIFKAISSKDEEVLALSRQLAQFDVLYQPYTPGAPDPTEAPSRHP